jgi:hypothetical protein
MSADGDFWCPSAGDMSYPLSIRLLRPPGRVQLHASRSSLAVIPRRVLGFCSGGMARICCVSNTSGGSATLHPWWCLFLASAHPAPAELHNEWHVVGLLQKLHRHRE